jgi:DNA segregation ATPase FtsK/SpoIIIE-like protein
VILVVPGAEELLGMGQMLARIPGLGGLVRLLGRYTSIEDVYRVITKRLEVRR